MLTTWFVRDAPRVWLRSRTHVTGRKPNATPREIYACNIYQLNCLHSILVSHLSQMATSGACGSVVERPLCISFGANLRKVRVSITRPSNSFAKISSSIKMCCWRFFVHVAACQERRSYYKLHLWCLLTMLSTFFHLIDRHIYKRMIDLRRKIGASYITS